MKSGRYCNVFGTFKNQIYLLNFQLILECREFLHYDYLGFNLNFNVSEKNWRGSCGCVGEHLAFLFTNITSCFIYVLTVTQDTFRMKKLTCIFFQVSLPLLIQDSFKWMLTLFNIYLLLDFVSSEKKLAGLWKWYVWFLCFQQNFKQYLGWKSSSSSIL